MSLSFNPQELPVIGIDDHLPSVASVELRAPALRRRFQQPPAWAPDGVVERRFIERELAHASVLVALVERDELTVLLTQRTDHLSDHPGQISFPAAAPNPRIRRHRHGAARSARGDRPDCRARGRAGFDADIHHRHRLHRHAHSRARAAGFRASGRSVRGCRGVRGAARIPDEPGPPPAPCGRAGRGAARVPLDALAGFRQRRSAEALFRLGRHGGMLRNLYRFLAA